MVDRVYKADLPRLKAKLEELKERFTKLDSKTDWTRLRVEPLLRHVDSLERLVRSQEFSSESFRLRRGVHMFHSDLVYLRENIKELQKLLSAEEKSGQ